MMRSLVFLLSVCWFCLASLPVAPAQVTSSQQNYVGTWVMKLGQRIFIVFTLEHKGGKFIGTFSRPEHFQSGDGASFSHLSPTVKVEPIVAASLQSSSLHFVVGNPKDSSDNDEYDMTLTSADQASVKLIGYPLDALLFTRSRNAKLPTVATDWDPQLSYSQDDQPEVPSTEMRRIFEEDQKPRQDFGKISPQQWTVIGQQDAERQRQTRDLLAAGKLHTGEDFTEAAFIFQHGSSPDDYLLAHTLAMVAVAKGDASALWIATATLDRYMQSIGKPQIYGTQFKTSPGGEATQEPYNPQLISDFLRRQLKVPPRAAQQEQLKYWQEQFKAAETKSK